MLGGAMPRIIAPHMACGGGRGQSHQGKKKTFLGKGRLNFGHKAQNHAIAARWLAPRRIAPHKRVGLAVTSQGSKQSGRLDEAAERSPFRHWHHHFHRHVGTRQSAWRG
ncbi:MAG: hypothetical protein ACKO9A_15905, partial [Alphaproteobacteria bacterium]